jgi:hypothetical protein
MISYQANFALKSKVIIDGGDLFGTVTAINFRRESVPLYEVSWTANGEPKVTWIEEYRLKDQTDA